MQMNMSIRFLRKFFVIFVDVAFESAWAEGSEQINMGTFVRSRVKGKVTRINRYGGFISGQVYTVRDQNSVWDLGLCMRWVPGNWPHFTRVC